MSTIVCPQCEKDDSLQRVSAVVAGGISTGSFSGPSGALTYSDGKVGSAGGYTHLNGGSSTNLAKMLELPPEPQTKGLVFPVLILIFGIWLIIEGISENAGVCLGGPGAIALIASLIWLANSSSNNNYVNSFGKANWDIFKKKWEQLYYCHRNGIVFDPETSKTCEPSQIKDFVNELIKDQIIKPESSGTGVSN